MIELRNVWRTYAVGQGLNVLRDIDLHVRANEYVGILGPSGSGKSTLLHLMGLLDRPTRGSVIFRGQETGTLTDRERSALRGRSIGFVFQSFHLVPQLTILENVELPLFYQGVPPRERRRRAEKCLGDVGLAHRLGHLSTQLSGGESQRTAIARALVSDPAVLLADEPTGNLDSATGREIIRLFDDLHARGHTVVVITHDPGIASSLPRTVRINDGKIQEGQPP